MRRDKVNGRTAVIFAEYIRQHGGQLRRTDSLPGMILRCEYASGSFLITVFHFKGRARRETSRVSLFMYEKCFKAARESTGAKIRVAVSKVGEGSSVFFSNAIFCQLTCLINYPVPLFSFMSFCEMSWPVFVQWLI